MSGILPDTTVTSATRFNAAVLNCTNSAAIDKCNCDAYVSWINAQLCENGPPGNNQPSLLHCPRQPVVIASPSIPNAAPVKDLSRDLRNGVVLARLAEKLSGDHLDKIFFHPVTRQQMLTNVDEVLKFALRWRVKMHPVLSTEIVDGDTRATLRLVLALAAHFRPGSVIRQIGGASIHSLASNNNNNVISKAPPASQRVITFSNNSNTDITYTTPPPTINGGSASCLSPILMRQDPQQFFSAKLLKYKAVRSPRTITSVSSATSSNTIFTSPTETANNNTRPSSAQFDDENDECSNSREDSQVSSPLSHEAQAGSNGTTSICSLESNKPAMIDEQEFIGLQSEIASAKKTLLVLQQMLFEQDGANNDSSITTADPMNGGGGVSVNANSNKLVNGHSHDNATILQLRAQIRELSLTLEELAVEKHELQCRLVDRDRQLQDLQTSLSERDRLIAHLQIKVHDLIDSGRREVAELKELAISATSPVTSDTPAFFGPNNKKYHLYNNNNNHLNNTHNLSSPDLGDNELSSSNQSVEESPIRNGGKTGFVGCRVFYYNNDGAGPYCLFASKPLDSLCLRDIRQLFGRFGRKYRFRFFPLHELERKRAVLSLVKPPVGLFSKPAGNCNLDPSLATLELRNDDDPLPGFDNQIFCKVDEV